MRRPPSPPARRGAGRAVSISLLVLLALALPTLVVFAFMHSLPDSRLGEFTRHEAPDRAGHAGRGLSQQLFGGEARGRDALKSIDEQVATIGLEKADVGGAIMRGGGRQHGTAPPSPMPAGRGIDVGDGEERGSDGGMDGGSAGSRHGGGERPASPPPVTVQEWRARAEGQDKSDGGRLHVQQQQQQQEEEHEVAAQRARARAAGVGAAGRQQGKGQQLEQHALHAQQQEEQQQGQQGSLQERGQQRQQQQQQRQQGQQQRQQGQQQRQQGQQQRQQAQQQGQAQHDPWTNTLLKASGKPVQRPNCKDRAPAKDCQEWAAGGECLRRPSFMYQSCAAACGLCHASYLHGAEVAAQVELVPGVSMPMVGYGTAGLADLTADAVFTSIRLGYRLVDSAGAREWYREDLVGWGWSASGIKREHLFVTSKIHPKHHGYWSVLEVFSLALQDLQTDYVDLMLLHYPECWKELCGDAKIEGDWKDSWAALEQLVVEKKLRAAGVSNFNLEQMQELVSIAKVKPALLQANSDLLRQNWELQAFCRQHGIQFQAYSSLGGQWLVQTQGAWNPVLDHPVLVQIARAHQKTTGQVALRWALQHGQAVVPRTTKVNRMEENLALFDFDLTDSEMQQLDALDGTQPVAPGQQAQQAQQQGGGGGARGAGAQRRRRWRLLQGLRL